MAAEKLIPPPVPEEENFAATPFLAAILEKGGDTESPEWPDDFTRADKWARQFPVLRDSASGQKTGRLVTDLVSWQKAFEESQSLNPRGAEIVVAETPDPATNAQAALAVLTALQPYEPVLRELRAASQRPHSRFNVHYELDNPWATLLPQLAVVKRTCQLVRLKTSAELAAGQAEEALRDAVLMLRLTDAPAQEPVLISQLVRVACWQIALQSIWEGLMQRRWSGAQLQTLQSHFEHFDFLADLKRVMEAERVWGNLTIAIMRDRRPPNFLSSLLGPDEKSESWRKEADRALAKCPREWFDAEQRNFNRLFDERVLAGFDVESRRVFPSVAESNARVVEQSVRETKNLVKDHLVFARAALISPAKIHLKLAHAQASADFAALACALERHRIQTGQFPETLAELSPALPCTASSRPGGRQTAALSTHRGRRLFALFRRLE
jgi:hypothetical protein